jgi:hypothetical protein
VGSLVCSRPVCRIDSTRSGGSRHGTSVRRQPCATDLLTLTLIEASLRGGDAVRARHYVAERLVHKPASAWGERLWARTGTPARLPAAA